MVGMKRPEKHFPRHDLFFERPESGRKPSVHFADYPYGRCYNISSQVI